MIFYHFFGYSAACSCESFRLWFGIGVKEKEDIKMIKLLYTSTTVITLVRVVMIDEKDKIHRDINKSL